MKQLTTVEIEEVNGGTVKWFTDKYISPNTKENNSTTTNDNFDITGIELGSTGAGIGLVTFIGVAILPCLKGKSIKKFYGIEKKLDNGKTMYNYQRAEIFNGLAGTGIVLGIAGCTALLIEGLDSMNDKKN